MRSRRGSVRLMVGAGWIGARSGGWNGGGGLSFALASEVRGREDGRDGDTNQGAARVRREEVTTGSADGAGRVRLGILLSGGGRTLQNIHDCIQAGELDAEIACVISSRADVHGVERARRAGLPVHVVSRRDVADPEFHDRIERHLTRAGVGLVCMAGFCCLWRIPPAFAGRVLNIHPALLPEFGGRGCYGEKVHAAVLAAGRRRSGCTVHFCDDAYDHGPIVLQREVPVLDGDTPATLAARVFDQECIAYPEAIRMFIRGEIGAGVSRGR